MRRTKKIQRLKRKTLEERKKVMGGTRFNSAVKINKVNLNRVNPNEMVFEVLFGENQDGKEIVCELTAIPVRKSEYPAKHYPSYQKALHKRRSSRYRLLKRPSQYKLQNRIFSTGTWDITRIDSSVIPTPKNLINKDVLISNGKDVFCAKVIRVCSAGGGTTGPATQDGLPEVDE